MCFGYDSAGNVVSDTRAGVVITYAYDALGRLTMTRQAGTPVGLNVYDGMSRLARRTVAGVSPSGTTHYLALAGGGGDFLTLMPGLGAAMGGLGNRILAEIDDATGTTTREYLWLGDRVVAVAPAGPSSATLYYVTTDHLTRPVQMTGPSKAVVWRAKYGPFGEVLETTGPASLAARYPGQWFQLENGLAWNWHRHYDASLGRYVQPDPLGLVDGPSVYGYAGQSPFSYVDPMGLALGDYFSPEFVSFSAGFADTMTFGLTDSFRDYMGTNGGVDKCSPYYSVGNAVAVAVSAYYGGALGWEAAGTKGAGKEFSHWYPKRWGGPRTKWNGNFVSRETHALSDPYRYRFMSREWKDLNPPPNMAAQQWARVPNVYKGAMGGAGYGAGGAFSLGECECAR